MDEKKPISVANLPKEFLFTEEEIQQKFKDTLMSTKCSCELDDMVVNPASMKCLNCGNPVTRQRYQEMKEFTEETSESAPVARSITGLSPDKYFEGRCHICGETKQVRWKNIYHMGSEGLDICLECERELLKWIEGKKHEAFIRRRDKVLQNKKEKKS